MNVDVLFNYYLKLDNNPVVYKFDQIDLEILIYLQLHSKHLS